MSAAANFSIQGRVVAITGGSGVIGGTLALGLAAAGARVALVDRNRPAAEERSAEIRAAGGEAMVAAGDVLDVPQMCAARDAIVAAWGHVDALVNAAGGNVARSRSDNGPVFDVPMDAFDEVLRLNLHGSVQPSLIFAEAMAARGSGSIVLISSMAATQAISGVLGYSVAKAGVDNFTRWMATELARKFGDGLRVNAIAPGFFVTHQNRDVLITSDGSYTPRSRTILGKTPMGRFGRPDELVGAVQWLCSDAASFVTGAVIPVDGGFSAFSGV